MMPESDAEYMDRIARSAAAATGLNPPVVAGVIVAALREARVDICDLRLLGSGDYVLRDGYCDGTL